MFIFVDSKVYEILVVNVFNVSTFVLSDIYRFSSFSNQSISGSRNICFLNDCRIHKTNLCSLIGIPIWSSRIEIKEPLNVFRSKQLIFGIVQIFICKEQVRRSKGFFYIQRSVSRISNSPFIGSLKLLSDGQHLFGLSCYTRLLI